MEASHSGQLHKVANLDRLLGSWVQIPLPPPNYMNISYQDFTDSDSDAVASLIEKLYSEDKTGKPITLDKIQLTFKTLISQPSLGEIVVIKNNDKIIGYTILINFWSNEFGGNILNIDELYVVKEFRSLGIGTNLIKYLAENKYKNSVAIQLEATPENVLAKKLYKRLGFKNWQNECLIMELN